MKGKLSKYKRIVVKIGSSLLIQREMGLNRPWLATLASDLGRLSENGAEVLVVTSGAIALGRSQMKDSDSVDSTRPYQSLKESQAAAAVGQIELSGAYASELKQFGLKTAQILLTLVDTETRRQFLNAQATIGTLLKWGVVPIINENDTVATTEIRYGDNDRLAARVASMMEADLLILLSDVDGLYNQPPAENLDAELVSLVPKLTAEIMNMAGGAASGLSRGGMKTKLEAAQIATAAGVTMVISSGCHSHPLRRVDEGLPSTWFQPNKELPNAKRKWIAGGLLTPGKITIDQGAVSALESGKSLLPAGLTSVEGDFSRGDTVLVLGPAGQPIGRGLIEYDASDARLIKGLKSHQIREQLGPSIRTELIHRDNLALN